MRKLLIVLASLFAAGQTPRPAFDAVSVKVNPAQDGLARFATSPARFNAVDATLHLLVRYAFDVPDYRLANGPRWMDGDRFDVDGVAGRPAEPDEMRAMARAMLEDRFMLRTHVEQRDQPIFVLTVARRDGKLGDQMSRSGEECKPVTPPPGMPPPSPPPVGAAQGARGCPSMSGVGNVSLRKIPLSLLISNLSSYLNRHIVDQTNLTGMFDVDLRWAPDQLPKGAPGAPMRIMPFDPNGPSLSTALQEQLGLKLESARGPVDVLVIDDASKPSSD